MKEKKKQKEEAAEEVVNAAPAEESEQAPAPEQESREEQIADKKLSEELESVKKEKDELNDKYLRLAAEYENFKKRNAKEKEELFAVAKAQVVKSLLPVFDNMDRAKEYTSTDKDKLAEGVDMILKQFTECLGKNGITEIAALGETFDPELHEAVFHEDVEGEPENTVNQVLQKGYICDGKVIRHAMVKVVN